MWDKLLIYRPLYLGWKHSAELGQFTAGIEMRFRSRARQRRPLSWAPIGSTLTQKAHVVASLDPGSSKEVECLTGRWARGLGDNQEGQCAVWFHNQAQPVRAGQFQPNRAKKKIKKGARRTKPGQDGCLTEARICGLAGPGRLRWASSEVWFL